eukprot:753915-Hanusia_phi.AAC.20
MLILTPIFSHYHPHTHQYPLGSPPILLILHPSNSIELPLFRIEGVITPPPVPNLAPLQQLPSCSAPPFAAQRGSLFNPYSGRHWPLVANMHPLFILGGVKTVTKMSDC